MVNHKVGDDQQPDVARRSSRPMLLNQDRVGDYLLSRRIGHAPYTDARTLAGGVSNIVVRVKTDGRHLVVKQSLETLAVADRWIAPTRRAITEAKVMALLGSVTPKHVPGLIDQDEVQHTIVMQSAPGDWADWKTELMSGKVDQDVAQALGSILAIWHQQTSQHSELLEPNFDEYEAFEALRVDPYFRTAAARAPEVSCALMSLVHDMASRRSCLVHGDFSPKNVLVGPGAAHPAERDSGAAPGLWVIDFEVAHRGDPAFDVAFMCTHLLMKSYVMVDIAGELDAARNAFVAAYSDARFPILQKPSDKPSITLAPPGRGPDLDWSHLSRIIGSLLIARIKGKSPAGYLDDRARQQVWSLGLSLLREPAGSAAEITGRRNEHSE
jgi:aminoglycoside phosphotransferase (APT) family kinase protein